MSNTVATEYHVADVIIYLCHTFLVTIVKKHEITVNEITAVHTMYFIAYYYSMRDHKTLNRA